MFTRSLHCPVFSGRNYFHRHMGFTWNFCLNVWNSTYMYVKWDHEVHPLFPLLSRRNYFHWQYTYEFATLRSKIYLFYLPPPPPLHSSPTFKTELLLSSYGSTYVGLQFYTRREVHPTLPSVRNEIYYHTVPTLRAKRGLLSYLQYETRSYFINFTRSLILIT